MVKFCRHGTSSRENCVLSLTTFLLSVCTECFDTSTKTCYLCENDFDSDELQKFQPGFILNWKPQSLECPKLKKPVSSAMQDAEDGIGPRAGIEELRPVAALNEEPLIRPPQQRRKKKKFGDGHECEFDRYAADGKCIHCLETHERCNLLNARKRCEVCHRTAEDCPNDDSKSSYLISRLLELHRNQQSSAPPQIVSGSCDKARPLKVIVFSQFRASLNNTGHRLLRRFGPACVAEYFGRHRKQELHKFTHHTECFLLLLTRDGAGTCGSLPCSRMNSAAARHSQLFLPLQSSPLFVHPTHFSFFGHIFPLSSRGTGPVFCNAHFLFRRDL